MGVADGQNGTLVSLPGQRDKALLAGSTALVPPEVGDVADASIALSADRNLFFDHDLNDFVASLDLRRGTDP